MDGSEQVEKEEKKQEMADLAEREQEFNPKEKNKAVSSLSRRQRRAASTKTSTRKYQTRSTVYAPPSSKKPCTGPL
jgi:hypothetical protein